MIDYNLLNQLIYIWLLCWVITRFEPLKFILEALPNKLIPNLLKLLLTCLKCVSFWITLVYTHDLFLSSGLAFVSFWYDKWVGPLERKVRL